LSQQNVHFSFFRSIAICANPNSKRAALERVFQKKNFPRTQKKTGVPAFSTQTFFPFVSFLQKNREVK